jgi:hypothetical protein
MLVRLSLAIGAINECLLLGVIVAIERYDVEHHPLEHFSTCSPLRVTQRTIRSRSS